MAQRGAPASPASPGARLGAAGSQPIMPVKAHTPDLTPAMNNFVRSTLVKGEVRGRQVVVRV